MQILLLAASLGLGYYLGSRYGSTHITSSADKEESKRGSLPDDGVDKDEVEERLFDGDLGAVVAGVMDRCKLVIVVRTDLQMSPGKIAAQCGHATLACYKSLLRRNPQLVRHWEHTGQAKIALKGVSEEQLEELEAIARSLNLCARPIYDQGRTEVAAGTRTVLGIGPAPVTLVDQVTGKLRLL